VDPFAPSIDISIEKYTIMYEYDLYGGSIYYTIALMGKGCFLGIPGDRLRDRRDSCEVRKDQRVRRTTEALLPW
jgi:hypothetical protein